MSKKVVLSNVSTQQCVQYEGPNAPIHLGQCIEGSTRQQWNIVPSKEEKDSVLIESVVDSDQCWDVYDVTTLDSKNASLRTYKCGSRLGNNRQWRLLPSQSTIGTDIRIQSQVPLKNLQYDSYVCRSAL